MILYTLIHNTSVFISLYKFCSFISYHVTTSRAYQAKTITARRLQFPLTQLRACGTILACWTGQAMSWASMPFAAKCILSKYSKISEKTYGTTTEKLPFGPSCGASRGHPATCWPFKAEQRNLLETFIHPHLLHFFHLCQNFSSSNLRHLVDFQVAFLRMDSPENKHNCLTPTRTHQSLSNPPEWRELQKVGHGLPAREEVQPWRNERTKWNKISKLMTLWFKHVKHFLPTAYVLPFPVVLMRALICAREYGSSEWPSTWTPSMWEDNAAQNVSRQTITIIWYCMNLYAMQSQVSRRCSPNGRRQLAPMWAGAKSALSNIKLMGRTIGASTALHMIAAKHCQVSLPFCILPSSWKRNFELWFATTLSPLD